jgi:phosphonate transport system substrate-binding protein
MKIFINILFAISLIALGSCENPSDTEVVEVEKVSSKKVLKIGIVPQFSSKRILSIWSPIIKELEIATGYSIQIVGTPSIPKFEAELAKGTYDIAYANPYHSVIANKQQGYEAILFDGSKKLFGVLAVRSDDEIKNIVDLNGEILSFPAPNALGASLLMRTELKNIHQLEIEPLYVKTHTNVYLNVVEGKTRAGGGVMRTFNELSDDIKAKLRIFYSTQKVPSHPIIVHPRVEASVVKILTEALLEMGTTENGKSMLAKIPIKEIKATEQSEYDLLEDMGMEDFYVEAK